LLVATALITWQLVAAGPALAKAGDLDPSFGQDGIVTTDFNNGSDDRANAMVIQPDGMLVAAGAGSAACATETAVNANARARKIERTSVMGDS